MKNLMKNKKRKIIIHILITFMMIFMFSPSVFAYQEVEYVEAVVIFEPGVNVDIPGVEIRYYYDSLNGFAGRMSYSTYKWLEKAWFVRAIDLNSKIAVISEYDPGGGGSDDLLDWGIDDIDAERVWGGCEDTYDVLLNNYAGDNVKVCIIDGGIDYNHPDLSGNYKGGYDFVSNDDDPMDEGIYSHGTHVAGIIGAEDNGGGVIGVAPKVDLYAVRALDATGDAGPIEIVAAINWAIDHEMDIISMSFGWHVEKPTVEVACDDAYKAGIILVASSGNTAESQTSVHYPAAYDDYVIAVGAVDIDHTHPSWSCYGDELDVVAPGVNIYSTIIDSFGFLSGTSMAVPMVTGVCALILSANPTLSNDDVKGILLDTATDLGYNDGKFGEGLINAQLAVATTIGDTTNPSLSITSPSGMVSGIVTISASASDNYGIFKVQYNIDNNYYFWFDDETAPYQWQWNTNYYSDGAHTITCRAWDIHGNYAEDQITVWVDNQGRGCPILSVYDGIEYIEEGLLDIHNPEGIDVVTNHTLVTIPGEVNHRYLLRLTEHNKTISHIDNVRLYGRLPNGILIPLPLISAVHSALGQVRRTLSLSDDNRVDVLGGDHNEGNSEFIDLEFIALINLNFIEFIFVIEGNNILIK
jgi:subtilisin family serine protease